jgi:hypothetical protein
LMRTVFVCVAVFALSVGCATMGESEYFPIDTRGVRGVSEFESRWYGAALKKMGETSIQTRSAGSRVFRFTLLPTWGNPISVRLSIDKGIGRIEGKRLDGQGGYDPGKLVETTSITLSEAERDEFLALFTKMKFFRLKTADRILGKDGSQWILEVVDEDKYHVVVRWSPTAYNPPERRTVDFVNVCEWLYKKSRFRENATNKGDVEIGRE